MAGEPRQFCELTDGEVGDLADDLVFHLAGLLGVLNVAGAVDVAEWELAGELRHALERHHRQAQTRAHGQPQGDRVP